SGATQFETMNALDFKVYDIPNPDLIIINHGHNSFSVGEHITLQEYLRLWSVDSPIAVVKQNPRRDDDQMTTRAEFAVEAALPYKDSTVLDVFKLFIDAGKPSSWYADNIHPSTLGQ